MHDWRKSGIKGAVLSSGAEKYVELQWVWIEKGMETFREYLEYYNNLDVTPFVTAIERPQKFYRENQLDVFKISISVPGAARNIIYRAAKESGVIFILFPKDKTVTTNICGGPSTITTTVL